MTNGPLCEVKAVVLTRLQAAKHGWDTSVHDAFEIGVIVVTASHDICCSWLWQFIHHHGARYRRQDRLLISGCVLNLLF